MVLERFCLMSLFWQFPYASDEIGIGFLSLKGPFQTFSTCRKSCSLSKWEFLESRESANFKHSFPRPAGLWNNVQLLSCLWFLCNANLHITWQPCLQKEGDGCQESNGRPKAIKQTCHFQLLTLPGRNNQSLSHFLLFQLNSAGFSQFFLRMRDYDALFPVLSEHSLLSLFFLHVLHDRQDSLTPVKLLSTWKGQLQPWSIHCVFKLYLMLAYMTLP